MPIPHPPPAPPSVPAFSPSFGQTPRWCPNDVMLSSGGLTGYRVSFLTGAGHRPLGDLIFVPSTQMYYVWPNSNPTVGDLTPAGAASRWIPIGSSTELRALLESGRSLSDFLPWGDVTVSDLVANCLSPF